MLPEDKNSMIEKPIITLHRTVDEIIAPADPSQPEKAQIAVLGATELPQVIRIDNTLTTEDGKAVRLTKGATVNITIKA
jgi:hypothetical protein